MKAMIALGVVLLLASPVLAQTLYYPPTNEDSWGFSTGPQGPGLVYPPGGIGQPGLIIDPSTGRSTPILPPSAPGLPWIIPDN